MEKPVVRETYYKMLHLSDLIAYWKSKGATDKDEQSLFDRLNQICYDTESVLINGPFILGLDEDPDAGSFDELLINEYPNEVGDLNNPYIEFMVDTE